MQRIENHPILELRLESEVAFEFEGKKVIGRKGHTVAAALHQAGFPVHSHSLEARHRSLECGIGKCGACEMLVDGSVRRVCVTPVDEVRKVQRIPDNFVPPPAVVDPSHNPDVYKTTVAIVGAGPAGLATREKLRERGIDCIVIDSNEHIGGQFLMQTHKFFFFEKERKYGGLRGFEIAETLAGKDHSGILLNSTVWDVLEGKRLACKNVRSGEIFFVDADYLVVAAGAVPFMPTFENDDLPGVYTAAVIQKMMNTDLTLLGKNILTVGAGNIGYLTSYQLAQAGARVKAIIEAQPREGGFPVQANRVRRLGIPILTSHILLKAVPNAAKDGVQGAIVARCENFQPVPGTERLIDGIDAINICTGLVPDDAVLLKGREMFGRKCFGAGDAMRIGEGTSAVLRGAQVAYEILEEMRMPKYDEFLRVSKEYIDSQQHPVRVIEEPFMPSEKRMEKPFILMDCVYGFACNPCQFACKYGAITKTSSSDVPRIDYEKCIGCMQCISLCPGCAIFGYNTKNSTVFLPLEFAAEEGSRVLLVDNQGTRVCEGTLEKLQKFDNKTNVARVKAEAASREQLLSIRGLLRPEEFPAALELKPTKLEPEGLYVCHCEDVNIDQIMKLVGGRNFITVEEVKHNTHLGMGPCRGKRCFLRLRQLLRAKGISLVGDAAPRAPLSAQVNMRDLYPTGTHENLICHRSKCVEVTSLVAGGGIAGSSVFRYLAEAGLKPLLVNSEYGSSWRNIAAGRPAFSVPELSEIARKNHEMFKELDDRYGIDLAPIHYISFAHDEATYKALEASMAWQRARMISPKDFKKEISPYYNEGNTKYLAALKTDDCWQATPGKTVNAIRAAGVAHGGETLEVQEVCDVRKENGFYHVTVRHGQEYVEYKTRIFVNAAGSHGHVLAKKLGIETGIFPVKHQAFITRRLPMLGREGNALDMLIDRRRYKGFCAVYGQQLKSTGQIIGCASPIVEPNEAGKDLRTNSLDFMNIVSEVFSDWIPELGSVGLQATWAGYYVEPRMVVDPELGLFIGMRGQGFMLSQYIAKLYVEKLLGKPVPEYFERLKLGGDGLPEKAFK